MDFYENKWMEDIWRISFDCLLVDAEVMHAKLYCFN